ncbi:sialate O-acetylesterase [Salinimicrobium sp. TIG7-5_MAKvit]|uniref:sialate O-acetylesterase n=1 Tax=Salinimicrobium sp. TIG7-5_MAKvit TaxID=3121289 RepID=UPI003C6E0C9E
MKNALSFIKQIPFPAKGICFFILVLSSFSLRAQEFFQLGSLFTDEMVLQREMPIAVWGTASPGTKVAVSMKGKKVSSRANADGQWRVELPALKEKGPYTIEISSGNYKEELKDVLVGDVWIASGQSNMEWPIRSTDFRETDTAWIGKAEIRLLKVQPEMDYMPRREAVNYGWQRLTPENIENFSAVAYHFGKSVHKNTGVPIGLISANLGATAIETWMSNEVLEEFPQFNLKQTKSFEELRQAFESGSESWSKEDYYTGPGMQEKWYQSSVKASSEWKPVEVAGNTWESMEDLRNFDGAVWFRKNFDLPENFKGDSLDLQLLQIDDYDITWVNGKKVGETFGRHNHRNYKVAASLLKERDNLLVVRVFDAGGIGGFTTNAFWGNEVLWGTWEYRKGKGISPTEFDAPKLPNASPFSSPSVLFNGTIAPLTALGIKGVIWYQGESNELRAAEYGDLFPALIRDWRKQFAQGDFPFLFVQLANYREETEQPQESTWAELREAQTLALQEPNTGMGVAIDLGEAGDIHPQNKEDVGKRLGMLALAQAYDRDVLARSPQYKDMELQGGKILLHFNFVGEGLQTTDRYGYIRGFQIAGADKKFYWAQACLQGDQIMVAAPEVKVPVAVRYAWSDNPGELDLYNSAGLPLAPFRTDDWSLSTVGKVFEDVPRF